MISHTFSKEQPSPELTNPQQSVQSYRALQQEEQPSPKLTNPQQFVQSYRACDLLSQCWQSQTLLAVTPPVAPCDSAQGPARTPKQTG